MPKSYFNKHSSYPSNNSINSFNSFDKKKYSTTFQGNFPSTTSPNNSSFLQTVKEGFGLGIGSSVGQLMTYSILGGPKVNVEHTYSNNNINPCINTNNNNCSNILLELEKCKNDFNCNFDKLDKLKNDYEKCKNLI
jgi:hypothetical protein